jgi:hypothetical protein
MAEPIEFCLHEFVSHSTVSYVQPRAITGFYCRLAQPMIGFHFVAKNQLGLALLSIEPSCRPSMADVKEFFLAALELLGTSFLLVA